MNYEEKQELMESVKRYVGLEYRECSVCQSFQLMVKIDKIVNIGTAKEDFVVYYRCFGCLNLFEEKLLKVEP